MWDIQEFKSIQLGLKNFSIITEFDFLLTVFNMGKIKILQNIKLAGWMSLSNDTEITKRISIDHYSKAYPIFLEKLQAKTEKICWEQAIFALHVVYGWMPTIPQLNRILNWTDVEKIEFIETLNQIITCKDTGCDKFNKVKEFSNNSAVGASKLLHFLSPKSFPIWDSRVAKTFFSQKIVSYNQVNNPSNWQTYTNTLRDWIKNNDVKKRCKELRRNVDFLKDVSDIRMVELVLFHKTKSNKK